MMQGNPAGSAMAALWGAAILSAAGEMHLTFWCISWTIFRCGEGAGAGGLSGRGHDYRRECPHCDCVYPAQSRLFVSDLYHWFVFFL